MQTAARYKAVLELMQLVFADQRPADHIINAYFRERRFIGSADRRFISETIWDVIRHRRRLAFDAGSADPRQMLIFYLKNTDLAEIFCGGTYGIAMLTEAEQKQLLAAEDKVYPPAVEGECPDWLFERINNPELLKALNQPAGADLRINRGSREELMQQLQKEGFEVMPTPYSPLGVRSLKRINLNNCLAYQEGLLEVQDEASQLAALLCDVGPNDRTIDYCCGAGGKSLAIAALLNGQGMIEAHDIDMRRLEQLKPRMQRLEIRNIKPVAKAEERPVYTRFIIDAPCSGTGTWRRSPDAKFRLNSSRLAELNRIQAEILETAYPLTAPGGRIVYITCSILAEENGLIVQSFMERHPDMVPAGLPQIWQAKTGLPYPGTDERWLELNPLSTGTDGFFVCVMEKR